MLSTPSARYAENQLAAQLLAAKANVKVGGNTCCGGIDTVITPAERVVDCDRVHGSTVIEDWQQPSAANRSGDAGLEVGPVQQRTHLLSRTGLGLSSAH